MSLRACQRCGAPFRPRHARHAFCAVHEPRGRANASPTTQVQDAEYRRERARVLAGNPPCHYCGRRPATTADHVVSVARGGGHVGNLVPACRSCNASKGARGAPRLS